MATTDDYFEAVAARDAEIARLRAALAEAKQQLDQVRMTNPEATIIGLTKRAETAERERDEARKKTTYLHKLVDLARNYIDPEEHPEWDKAASDELVNCDQTIDALRALVGQLVEALRWYAERSEYTNESSRVLTAAEKVLKS
jgi:multidrug efflux pump subunit AcrA (membrane-fusion protein)